MNEGDIVYIDYDAWIVGQDAEGDKLFETTSKEKAEENEGEGKEEEGGG